MPKKPALDGKCRRCPFRPWLATGTLGALLLGGGTALADARAEPGEPVWIAYRAPAGCPDAAAFVAQLSARTSRVRQALSHENARSFTVELSAREEGGGSHGQVTIREIDGRVAIREIDGSTCVEVATALALVVAVTIDPNASTSSSPKPAPSAVAPPRAPPASAAAVRPRTADRSDGPRWRFEVGAHAAAYGGLSPEIDLGVRGFLGFGRFGRGIVSPSVRLSFSTAESRTSITPIGRARFVWAAGRAETCPLRLRLLGPLSAQPCGFLEAGVLTGIGSETIGGTTQRRPWLAPGILARLEAMFFDTLLVEMEAGADLPLLRYRYYFGPNTQVHRVPAVTGHLAAGLGVRFP